MGPNRERLNSKEKPRTLLSLGSLVSPKFLEKLSLLFSISIISSKSFKYSYFLFVKGIYENNTYTKIVDFELENLESAQAKLDGSNLRRIKNSFIDEKGMLKYIIECENITIIQPDIESLKDLTEEEDKLKTELYNENNEIPREEEADFFGNNITFNLSNIKSKNYNNISLITNIKNEELTKNIFIYFDSFDYTPYLQEDENE